MAKLILGFFILSLIFFSFNLNEANAAWRNMANTTGHDNVSNSGWVETYDMALDSSGNPFMVWNYDASGGAVTETYIHFSKWTPGVGWTKMNGTVGNEVISTGLTYSYAPQIKLDSNNLPYVVWYDNSTGTPSWGNWKITFTKWTVGAGPSICGVGVDDCWTNMAGTTAGNEALSDGSPYMSTPQLVLNSSNNPNIAWSQGIDIGGGTYYWDVLFTHWDGSKWAHMDGTAGYENVSNTSSSNIGSFEPKIILDSSNNPNLIWNEYLPPHYQIFFSKWTPGTGDWTQMDGTPGNENISNSSVSGVKPDFKLDSANRPYIVWQDYAPGSTDIYLTKWTTGTGWTDMNGTPGIDNISNNSGSSDTPQIVLNSSGHPYLAWIDTTANPDSNDLYLTKWTPSIGWTNADGTSGYDNITNYNADYGVYSGELQLSSSGQPNISWLAGNNNTGASDIYFSKWSGIAWVKMDGSLGNENITNTGTASSYTNMELNSANEPFFPWFDYANGVSLDLFFTRWTTAAPSGLPPLTGHVNLTAEVEPSLSMTLTSTVCDLGSFDSANLKTCSYAAEVSTNGYAGYTALIKADGNLRNATNSITNVSGGSVIPATESYGLSTTQSSQTISQINDANSDTFYTQADCTALNNQAS
ncbi:MAG: hypothetical protein NT116_02365, partial [Candidatus Parcubacteria bacterium]|nr:hypothetical protein [Candidatus Parcubacteria bacterium]